MFTIPAHPMKYLTAKPQKLHETYHDILKQTHFPSEVQFGFNSKLVACPKLAKRVLKTLPKSSMFYDSLREPAPRSRFLGNGILTASNYDAKIQRRKFDEQFRKNMLEVFENDMMTEANQYLDTLCDNQHIHVQELSQTLTLNIVGKTLLGDVFDSDARDVLLSNVFHVNDEIVKQINPVYGVMRGVPAYTEDIHTGVEVIRSLVGSAVESARSDEEKTLLDIIIHTSNDEEEIIDNVLTFFLAGYDTTASALCTCLQVLHQDEHADILHSVLDELAHNETSVLDCVIKETLRLHPPSAGGILRTFKDEHKDQFPEHWRHNTDIIVPIYSLHRHPKYWDNPDVFIPSRWETTSEKEVCDVYMPFSVGTRNCIGKQFALLELKILLKTLLQNVQFINMTSEMDFRLNPVYGNCVCVKGVVKKCAKEHYQSVIKNDQLT